MKKYAVLGLGNPLVDVIIPTQDTILEELDIAKGSMNLVDVKRQELILAKHQDQEVTITLGGSCANTMVMIAQLEGKSAYNGKVGIDDFADDFEKQLIQSGTASFIKKQEGSTGSTVILISPDAERSMNTHLGMCLEFSKEDIDLKAIEDSEYIYVEGYLWDTPKQQEAVLAALEHAKAVGTKISLTLSDSFCVGRHQEKFQFLMDNYVDLLFCNDAEAAIMTGEKDPEAQLKKLSESVEQVVLTLGKQGSKILKDGTITDIKCFEVKAVDTTGAGDSFAAGYLYGITKDYTVEEAGNLAAYCAATVVSQIGPRYQGNFQEKVQQYLVK
ncbi:MAG: adenosine kinase [SAR324 cluster bacterium]|uniref:Adenosine kinase n=1 Tax=SAR324 cluster bacterium TaxID=2024889 RepID=A0A2A4TBD0_9DELT|nr:MAG: adenosine kinase [SAR324 cluster bacterium]